MSGSPGLAAVVGGVVADRTAGGAPAAVGGRGCEQPAITGTPVTRSTQASASSRQRARMRQAVADPRRIGSTAAAGWGRSPVVVIGGLASSRRALLLGGGATVRLRAPHHTRVAPLRGRSGDTMEIPRRRAGRP